jgi:hypothetical protein
MPDECTTYTNNMEKAWRLLTVATIQRMMRLASAITDA